MELIFTISIILLLICILILIYQQLKFSKTLNQLNNENKQLMESMEKYIEIFNEQNINSLISENELKMNEIADKKIKSIREEYKNRLSKLNPNLSEEHHMLIDFVTLSLSLLIKTPPNLREKIIDQNTDNEMIQQVLKSKLESIHNNYIPVSILEIALAEK